MQDVLGQTELPARPLEDVLPRAQAIQPYEAIGWDMVDVAVIDRADSAGMQYHERSGHGGTMPSQRPLAGFNTPA